MKRIQQCNTFMLRMCQRWYSTVGDKEAWAERIAKVLKTPEGARTQDQHRVDLKTTKQHCRAHQPFGCVAERAKPGSCFPEPQSHIIDTGGDGRKGGDQVIAHQVQQPDEEAAEKDVEKEEAPHRT